MATARKHGLTPKQGGKGGNIEYVTQRMSLKGQNNADSNVGLGGKGTK